LRLVFYTLLVEAEKGRGERPFWFVEKFI
jgi:hypothetical protein